MLLRFQATSLEIGVDSFLMHMMINSLTEYGYAKWVLHPLSFAGLYPYSYPSSVLFLFSGIQQTTGLQVDSVTSIYDIFLATFSIFSMYLMASSFIDDDFFKHLVAFIFSTSPAIVSYTTYTIVTRILVLVLMPLLICILLNRMHIGKKTVLVLVLILFLFVTHHLCYFILPTVTIYIILRILQKLKVHSFIIRKAPETHNHIVSILIPVAVLLISFSIPFVFKRFLEGGSRYDISIPAYIRYVGPLIIYSISGIFYLIFKQKKSFNEWLLLLSIVVLTAFMYIPTYLKWFVPVVLIPAAGIGIINSLKNQTKKQYITSLLIIILFTQTIFTGYYQFLHAYQDHEYDARHIEESTFKTGSWIKKFVEGNSISNDKLFSYRISAVSDTTHFLVPFTPSAATYGFIDINLSLYERYPFSSEEFWFDGYEGPDTAEYLWGDIHSLLKSPEDFEIKYVVENVKAKGNIVWNHAIFSSKVIELAHEESLLYDSGNIKIWQLP